MFTHKRDEAIEEEKDEIIIFVINDQHFYECAQISDGIWFRGKLALLSFTGCAD